MWDYRQLMRHLLPLFLVLTLGSGCALVDRLAKPGPATNAPAPPVTPPVTPPVSTQNPMVLGQGAPAAALDQTSDAEKTAALNAPATGGERELGKVTVTLGSPAEPGIWLRSALVSTAGKGRVVTSGGQSVAVDLLPGTGGAQLSLAAYLALGLSLTALPEVTVYAN